MNGSASRVLYVFLICVLLLTSLPNDAVVAQTDPSSKIRTCMPDTTEAPTSDPAYIQNVQEASEAVSATPVFLGEKFTAFEGFETLTTEIEVESFKQILGLGGFPPSDGNTLLVICLVALPSGDRAETIPLDPFFLKNLNLDPSGMDEGSQIGIKHDATQHLNQVNLGTDVATRESGYQNSMGFEYETWVSLPANQETSIALVFDIPGDVGDYYLSEGNRHSVMFGEVSGTQGADSSSASDQSTEAYTPSAQSFGEQILVTVFPEKWALTFDSNVEVRYFIGDQSITPRRGQFLVIWFDQSTPNNEPLPMGAFALRASTGPGEPFQTYDISREGTAALIVTEYDWHPDFMDDGVEYRTGVVFDIRPEDTHFELRFEVPGSPTGNELPVSITFDA